MEKLSVICVPTAASARPRTGHLVAVQDLIKQCYLRLIYYISFPKVLAIVAIPHVGILPHE